MKNGKVRIPPIEIDEAKELYALVGGRIAQIRDAGAINDLRASEIAARVAKLVALQDKILNAVMSKPDEEQLSDLVTRMTKENLQR